MTEGPPIFLSRQAIIEQGRLCLISGRMNIKIPAVLEAAEYLAYDEKRLYLAGQESGNIFVYDWYGQLSESVAVGEHLTGLALSNRHLYTISYHDNRLFYLDDLQIVSVVDLPAAPEQLMIFNGCPVVLCHDGFYSYLASYSFDLRLRHAVILERSLWKMKPRDGSLILQNEKISLFFNECLTLWKHKKRTVQGENP